MAVLKQFPVYCWISVILMSLAISIDGTEDDGHHQYGYDSRFENIHGDVAYDFVEESMSWAEAQKSCEDRGGHLLRDLNDEVKEFLQALSKGPGRWWVNPDSMSGHPMRGSDVNYPHHLVCTYLETEPFRVATTPNCTLSFGSLCTLDTKTHLKSNEAKHRHSRSVATINGLTDVIPLTDLMEKVKVILKDLETSVEVVTQQVRLKYLEGIYAVVKRTLPIPVDMAAGVMNSTSAMLLYTQECGHIKMAEFEKLITVAGLIYAAVKNGPVMQEMPTGTLFVDRKSPEQLGRFEIGSTNGTYCQLPSSSALSGQLPTGNVNVQLFQFKVNPMEDMSNESITGTTCSFSLQGDNNNITLKGLSENIEIFLPRADAGEPEVVSIEWKSGYSVVSSFNTTDGNMTVIVTATPSKNVTLAFQLFPSRSNGTNQNATASANISLKEGYRWLITPEMRKGGFSSWKVVVIPINYTSSNQLTVKVSVFVTKCLFWDTDLEQWSRDGCMVGPKTTPSLTHCLCNHTTFFGSSFFVMPNQVDLSQTAALFATVNENYIVVVLLSCFFAVFLVVLAWAWYADRKALRTRKMTLLDDNHPCAEYNYLITFQTGHRRKAGTSAKVRAILYFEEGKSETYNLSDADKPVFERGGVDVFLLSIPFSLGTLESIEIWHDNSSGDPDWYLNRLTVQDLQTQEITHFLCSTWLRGESCKRTFNSAKNNEIASFGDIFQTRTSSGFRDEHIWVSVVDPPRRSPFTRVQRVACCMSLLLCTMAINIMFWNLPTDEESPVLLKIGSFALTWQELIVAVESGLFMFPINILIITIFRHIKPRLIDNKEESSILKNKAFLPASVSMNTIIEEVMDLLGCLSKNPKNMLGKDLRSESSGDLFWALNKVHDLIERMNVEMVGDPHWSYCSRFLFYSLSHVSRLLDHVGEKGCFLNEELRQARGTLGVLLKKAELASLRHAAQTTVIVQEPQKKKGWWLPWWFLFVGWALLFFMSGFSTFFTLLYGFQYGRESSIQWVITLTMSLVQSIFILQPLKVILVAIFFAMILRPVAVDENEEVELLLKEQKKRCQEYSGRSTS
ncbi:Polycystic kidney disease protein 1-like 2 PC1-like 2 protein [Triplophysa tibetana]|uniref:Polycystic kidney disease protein 1-like 2 PC1-like 2 protein n=1 Tax=Triplophysa tibetana TaxID=1572043 RepID=A0A5A9PPZ2_9TELE|nr:Polycystic kidney disease protein 1-like 2 PC1-like 2 protein [Triplophysa tibetana]